MEQKISEKDRLISDARQTLDREAGERRRLSETLSRLQENADRAVAEKQTAITALEATLASYKSKIETLQSRVGSLEQMRRSEQDHLTKHSSSRQAILGRMDEASHLAVDLDHSLDSIEASIAALRDRARRLSATLQDRDVDSEASAPLSPEAAAPSPAVAHTDSWFDLPPTPAPVPEVAAEQAVEADPEPALEAADFSPVTRTQIRVNPYVEALPDTIEAVPSPEPALSDSEPVGRFDEPSTVMMAAAPAPEPVPASAAAEESGEDLPLISPPEDETPAPPPAAAPPPDPMRKKFSWQRK
jgi:hypothetical protein